MAKQSRPLFGAGSTVTTVKTISRTDTGPLAEARQRLMKAIPDADAFTTLGFVRAAYQGGAETVKVFYTGLDGSRKQVGVVPDPDPSIDDQGFDNWFLQTFKPGRYLFRLVKHGQFIGPQKLVTVGTPADAVRSGMAGGPEGTLDELDRTITDHAKRTMALAAVRGVDAMNRGGGDEDVKPQDMAALAVAFAEMGKVMSPARTGPDPEVVELRAEIRRLSEKMGAPHDPFAGITDIVKVIAPTLMGVLDRSPNLLTRMVALVTRLQRPAPVVPEPETGVGDWIESMMASPVLEKVVTGLHPFLTALAARLAQSGVALPAGPIDESWSVPSAPAGNGHRGGAAVPKDSVPIEADLIDYFVKAVGERRFPDARAALLQMPFGLTWLQYLDPKADAEPYFMGLRSVDKLRLAGIRDDAVEFIRWLQQEAVKAAEEE